MVTPSTSPAAIRQRRLRDRKRKGTILTNLEVGAGAIACLVRAGILASEKRTDSNEVRLAFGVFVRRALLHAANVARHH
jgi:hypothetical protein